jgi:hypothetical protein
MEKQSHQPLLDFVISSLLSGLHESGHLCGKTSDFLT